MKHILVLILTLAFALAPARADELLPLFDLQSQSGQLWTAIKAHLDAKDAKIATLTAERDALKQRLDAAAAAWAAQDLAKIGQLAAEAAKSEKQKAIELAEAKAADAARELAALKAGN